MSVTNKKQFKVSLDSKEVELCVVRPNVKQRQEGQKVYNKAFRDAVESGAILRGKVNNVMREQNLWDDNKEAEYRKLLEKINGAERKIKSGGIKLNQAKDLALEMRKDRAELRALTSERSSLDNNTAEGQADNAQFNYWVSSCTVYSETGKTYFGNYEDYLNRDDDPATGQAAGNLAMLLYNLDPDYEKKLPENQFLAKYNFVDEELHLVDKTGRRVDSEGRLVNKDGRYINEAGELIDIHGNRVNQEGDYVVDFSPFLDDEGKPIEEKVETVKTTAAPEIVVEAAKVPAEEVKN
jgi:uncharacterized HAD superfamily protein